MNSDTVISGVIAAVVGGAVTLLVATRRLSGKVATSEAGQLWKEAAAIRADCREQIRELRAVVDAQEATIDKLREELRNVRNGR